MKKVGFVYNQRLAPTQPLADKLARALQPLGVSTWIRAAADEDQARLEAQGSDLVVSIGGDGTILRTARIVLPWQVPILGVNLGKLGFMTELTVEEAQEKLPTLVSTSQGWLEERAMLRAELFPVGKQAASATFQALNDVVVARGATCRVIQVKTTIDGELLTAYRTDGVVVATATGSTGYVLSAGGPVLCPQARDIVLQPIAAHLAMSNALVLSPSAVVEMEVQTDHQAVLSIDGQTDIPLRSGDRVKASLSPYTTRFLRIKPPGYFYATLAQKLRNH